VIDLDDQAALEAADPQDALGAVERTPEQWLEAITRARAVAPDLPSRHGIGGIVYCGMGGSGIAGDVLAAIAAETSTVPVDVAKGYRLPSWAGPNTLVICASYSGNTEETLACFNQAVERKSRIVVLATGGALATRAAEIGIARVSPVEGLQPRQALASLSVSALVVAAELGLIGDIAEDLADAGAVIAGRVKMLGRDVPTLDNEAKTLAVQLVGKMPVVWGQEGVLSVAATRWRGQLNENAKVQSFSSILPELDHNEIVGYEPGAPGLSDLAIVVLRMTGENERIAKRIEVTLDRMRAHVGAVLEATATGETALARLISAIMLGDFTSVYLALRRGIDPTPVEAIEELKRRLG
jgi:glucose/mannose-6-phosphate isomerase